MDEVKIKEAFQGVKKDIRNLKSGLKEIKGYMKTLINTKNNNLNNAVLDKSKTSLRQEEKYVLHKFRQSRKRLAKQKILNLINDKVSTTNAKVILMRETGISKASFYNYLNEVLRENKISPSSLNLVGLDNT